MKKILYFLLAFTLFLSFMDPSIAIAEYVSTESSDINISAESETTIDSTVENLNDDDISLENYNPESTTLLESTEEISVKNENENEQSYKHPYENLSFISVWENRSDINIIYLEHSSSLTEFFYDNQKFRLYESFSESIVNSDLYIVDGVNEFYIDSMVTHIEVNESDTQIFMFDDREMIYQESIEVLVNTNNCNYEYMWVSNTHYGSSNFAKFTVGAVAAVIGAATNVWGALIAYVVEYVVNNRIPTLYWTRTVHSQVKRSPCNIHYPHWVDAGNYRYTIYYYSDSSRTNLIKVVYQ